MSQYVLFVCCWLLAVGRGSGLTGLTTRDHKTTRGLPHSPGPPATPALIPAANHSLANVTLTFYPLHVNTSGSTTPGATGLEGVLTTRGSTASTTPLPSPTLTESPVPTNPTHSRPTSTTYPPVSFSTKSPPSFTSEQKNTINTSGTTSTTVKPTTSFPKEQVQEVIQSSQKELFIRRKHKGPYYENRVKKLSATLRASDPPEVDDHTDNPKGDDLSSTLNSEKNVAVKAFRSINKNKVYKTTRRPHHNLNTTSVDKPNTTKKTPRKRPITMGIPASSTVLQIRRVTSSPPPPVPPNNPSDSDEYYSSYAEYPDGPNFGYNMSKYSEAAVLPDPDIAPGLMEAEAEVEAEVVLPDDSLADTDLHDHDLIDSVMYIYFGSSERDERGAGRQVLIVGAVISLVAQFLTLASVLRRLRSKPDESASIVLLNAELALTAANLVFMLGVQATGSQRRCELVAVTLHYLHLVACCWFLVNSIYSYGSLHPLQSEARRRLRPYWLAAWCLPAVIVLLCVGFNRRGYETRSFCWVSVARGMLYSFMVPVAVLIMLNTCFAVLGLRQLSLSKTEDTDRKSMRVSAILLPVFAVVWFLGVVALENSASLVFPLLFVASSGFLNWFVLACWLPADLSLWRDSDEDYDEDDDDLYEEVLKTQTDSQPLLEEPPIYVCGRRDMCELQMDPICTISS